MTKRDDRRVHAAREQLRDRGWRTNPKNVLRNDAPQRTSRAGGPKIELRASDDDPYKTGRDSADEGVTSVATPILLGVAIGSLSSEDMTDQVTDATALAFGFLTRKFELALEACDGDPKRLAAGLMVKVTVTEID
ncbi:hypothetical protein [Mycobacterium sp.]|uniref:hypothetical protein n=1 Tax=Mycobacterium sp. TaxID=1785 RepID=UPI002608A3A2|nr:hypothetical protein [Mycobacterium sp.]